MTALTIIGAAFGLGYALVNFSARMSPLSIGEALWWGDAETLSLAERAGRACKYCGATEAAHEPSGCCGDGGGSIFASLAVTPTRKGQDRATGLGSWVARLSSRKGRHDQG